MKTYSTIDSVSHTTTTSGSGIIHQWDYYANNFTDSTNELVYMHFIPTININFISLIKFGVKTTAYVSGSMRIGAYLTLPNGSSLTGIRFSSIVFNPTDFKNSTNY